MVIISELKDTNKANLVRGARGQVKAQRKVMKQVRGSIGAVVMDGKKEVRKMGQSEK